MLNLQEAPPDIIAESKDPAILDDLTKTPIVEIGQQPASGIIDTAMSSLGTIDILDDTYYEYIVTLHDQSDLGNFYDEMEHAGSRDGLVPERVVDVAKRREISRNTHYYLTHAEAELLRNDPRVIAVELPVADRGGIVRPMAPFVYSANWDKSANNTATSLDWGPLRVFLGQTVAGWGSDGTILTSGDLRLTAGGKNVDVVIVDGLILPDHPEYAVNPDGTGGTRVVQYNWFGGAGTYNYNTGSAGNRNHGMHVAGIACGNTMGMARDSNIYNIGPYGENGVATEQIFDYIRTWHNAKQINPVTGRKNPTITNNSYGVYNFDRLDTAPLTRVDYRGVAYTPTAPATSITVAQALTLGVLVLYASGTIPVALYQVRNPSFDADITDAINDGILVVGAAGNWYNLKNDVTTGVDYNNAFYRAAAGTVRNQNQGISPACAGSVTDGAISVMNIDATVIEYKADTSCSGPRNQVAAPGTNIFSSHFDSGVADPRNAAYWLAKLDGTSMASPLVCGALACMLEQYPWVLQTNAITYLNTYSTSNQIIETGSATDMYAFKNLRLAPNKYLFFNKERPDSGPAFPHTNYWIRPSSGVTWPRRGRRSTQPQAYA
jgi:hypothetical protein